MIDIDELKKPLAASNVSSRQGPGGKALSYVAGFYVIETANRVFGFDGWSYEVQSFREVGKGVIAHVRVTVQTINGPVIREDVGWGQDDPEKAVKEAVTDALKRALRTFGDQFGNSLYDKDAAPPQKQRAAAPKKQDGLGICPKHNIAWVQGRAGVGHVVEGEAPCLKESLLAQ